MAKKIIKISLFLLLFTAGYGLLGPLYAADNDAFRSTSYPLPRFVSLSADEVYVRTGPGQRYPVKFLFKKRGLPVEVILEYEVWRKIKDYEGEVGWIHQSLTSGERTGLIQGKDLAPVYKKPDEESRRVAYIEPGVVGGIGACKGAWCRLESSGYKGWVRKEFIWGVYSKEDFN